MHFMKKLRLHTEYLLASYFAVAAFQLITQNPTPSCLQTACITQWKTKQRESLDYQNRFLETIQRLMFKELIRLCIKKTKEQFV